ncbi:MAG: ABC transporter ATP-binding protein, partial [Comamonadaceae bacterium]
RVHSAGPTQLRPAEWTRQVLVQAGAKGLTPLQLGWRRFDARRLPALVLHAQRWWLAEAAEGGEVRLSDADGTGSVHQPDALHDALVLWVRTPPRSGPVTPLAGNLALRLVWQALFRDRGWVAKVLVATVLVNLLAVATSLFAMQVYDRVVPTLAYATLTTLAVGMALVMVIDWVLKTVRARILDSLSCEVDERVSQQVFDHLLRLRLDLQPTSLGTLAAQVGGLDAVRQFFSSSVIFALVDLPFALLFLAFIGIVGGAVGWVYALLLPIALALGFVTQRRMRRLLQQQTLRSNERQGLLVDTIRGAESIRAGNAGWRFSQEWRAITASIDGYSVQQKAIATFSTVTTGTLSTA